MTKVFLDTDVGFHILSLYTRRCLQLMIAFLFSV